MCQDNGRAMDTLSSCRPLVAVETGYWHSAESGRENHCTGHAASPEPEPCGPPPGMLVPR